MVEGWCFHLKQSPVGTRQQELASPERIFRPRGSKFVEIRPGRPLTITSFFAGRSMNQQAQVVVDAPRSRFEPLFLNVGWAWARLMDLLLTPFYALYRMRLEAEMHSWRVPNHIGIIMDGNRRFARRNLYMSILKGHARGADKLEELLNWCEEARVRVVTVWIFSLDNFNRDPDEVNGLMELFQKKFLELATHPRIHKNQIRVRSLGKIDTLPEPVRAAIQDA